MEASHIVSKSLVSQKLELCSSFSWVFVWFTHIESSMCWSVVSRSCGWRLDEFSGDDDFLSSDGKGDGEEVISVVTGGGVLYVGDDVVPSGIMIGDGNFVDEDMLTIGVMIEVVVVVVDMICELTFGTGLTSQ